MKKRISEQRDHENTKGIIWLASYPRSGNTWMRIALSYLTEKEWNPEDINSIPIVYATGRTLFDDVIGVESSDLADEQIELLRPQVYEQMAGGLEEYLFCKIHDAWTLNSAGEPVLSANATAGAIYIVRNPLDVAVSFAHFLGKDVEHVIRIMEDPGYIWYREKIRLIGQLPQRLLSWSGHVLSWIETAPIPVHVVRYEDMKERTVETFSGVVRFAGLKHSQAEIEGAIKASSFERLQELEKKTGFREKPSTATSFFRKGVAGSWREALTDGQVKRIMRVHGAMMRRLGYLDEAGNLLC